MTLIRASGYAGFCEARTGTRLKNASSCSSCCGTVWRASSAAGTSFTKSTTVARPRKSGATVCSAHKPLAMPIDLRDSPRSAWPSTTWMAGGSPISAIQVSSAITQCAEPNKSQAHIRRTVCPSVTDHRADVRVAPIMLKKSLRGDGRNFPGPLTRFVRSGVRDHGAGECWSSLSKT
jgi:hypothetical protein